MLSGIKLRQPPIEKYHGIKGVTLLQWLPSREKRRHQTGRRQPEQAQQGQRGSELKFHGGQLVVGMQHKSESIYDVNKHVQTGAIPT